MLLILSPSKTLDFETPVTFKDHSQPVFLSDAEKLVKELRRFSEKDIAAMMELSPKLAKLNAERFKSFKTPFTPANARQAMLAFKGDVYQGIEVEKYKATDFAFAQEHVRILSGLYGLLRPLDLIQPYRLEMGRQLTMGKTKDLYGFWGSRISEALNRELKNHKSQYVINLASEEYAGAMDRKALTFPVINVIFKEKQGDRLKVIGLFAKRARGLMANDVITGRLDNPAAIKAFNCSGYNFQPNLSDEINMVFVRKPS